MVAITKETSVRKTEQVPQDARLLLVQGTSEARFVLSKHKS